MNQRRPDSQRPGRGLWSLPQVLGAEARRVRLREPRTYYAGRQRKEAREAVEIQIQTSFGLPIRAISPVLFVGEVPVVECKQAGKNLYRYIAYEPETLQSGAPISLGWLKLPKTRVDTGFRYQPQGPVAS